MSPVDRYYRTGVSSLGLEIGLGAGDEEGSGQVQAVQPLEVQIAAVHDIEGAGLGQQLVEHVDIVQFPVGDVNEARDVAAQIDKRVKLDCRFGRTKWCPRKQHQTQIDRRSIERVDGVLQIHPEGFVHIEAARGSDQMLRDLRMNAPIARFVGVGQRTFRHDSTNTKMVELGRLRTQAGDDVAQAVAVGELREGHAAKLIGTAEIADAMIATITIDNAPKGLPRQMLHKLREHQLTCVHRQGSICENQQLRPLRCSSR